MRSSAWVATLPSAFLYVGAGPVINTVSPNACPMAGGVTTLIAGLNIQAGATVTFGGVPAPFSVNWDGQITATVPDNATPGLLTVTGSYGSDAALLGELAAAARQNQIFSLSEVRWAVLETNGQISFLERKDS